MNQITYEVKGKTIKFHTDLTLLGIETVDMELVCMDITQYGELDMLPLPADFESQMIDELYREFVPVQPEPGLVNPYSNAGQPEARWNPYQKTNRYI